MGEDVRERVKERYAGAALTVLEGTGAASCCGSAGERGLDSEALGTDWTGGGYSAEELGGLPEAAGAASLGCGNPTALTTLSPGEVVLDLGSGGIDVLLSTKRDEYAALLRETGFEAVSVEVTHTYERDFGEVSGCCGSGCCGGNAATSATTAAGEVPLASAFIRGRKP